MFYSSSGSKWCITLKDWIKNDEVRIYTPEIPFLGVFPLEGVNIDFRGNVRQKSFSIHQAGQNGVSHLKIG